MQIEYLVISYDDENKKACLSLRQAEILSALAEDEKLRQAGGGVPDLNAPQRLVCHIAQTGEPYLKYNARAEDPLPTFHPEFGRFMLEATPGAPYGLSWKDLLAVEPNMKLRFGVYPMKTEKESSLIVKADYCETAHGGK